MHRKKNLEMTRNEILKQYGLPLKPNKKTFLRIRINSTTRNVTRINDVHFVGQSSGFYPVKS